MLNTLVLQVEEATNDNPVASQINKLHAAFGKFG